MDPGVKTIYIVFAGPIGVASGANQAISVSNGTGSTELVTGVFAATTTVLNDTLLVTFSGDAPQAGDTDWRVDISNGLGRITGENGVPIEDVDGLIVTVISGASSAANRLSRFGRGDLRLARR